MPNEPTFCRPYNGRRTTVWPHDATVSSDATETTDDSKLFKPRRRRRALFEMPQPKSRRSTEG